MTTLSPSAAQPVTSSLTASLFRGLGHGVSAVVDYFARRNAIKTLNELDDRALRDIGIERSRIDAAVRGISPDFGGRMM
jgi:uncharacterized protein YjiS (DUF1127 family)